MAKKNMVFVYGTLKRGFVNNRLLCGSKFLGKARTEGKFALYEAGISFVIEDEQVSKISGEVYEVDERTLARLDRLEGHPSWYCRKMVNISINNKDLDEVTKMIEAWIYFFPVRQGVILESGMFGRNL